MIRCVIIDDEQPSIEVLKNYIHKTPGFELVGSTVNPVEGLDIIRSAKADLVFLDIQMDEMDGLELMRLIGRDTKVIFCTAYPEFAVASYELEAVDYLLKPIPFKRFLKAVMRVADRNGAADGGDIAGDYMYVKAEHKGKMVKIDFDEIDYIESKSNYVAFVRGTKQTLAYLTMRDLEKRLPFPKLARVHKSYIVAVSRIAMFENGSLELKGSAMRIPIGDTYREAFMEIMRNRLMT